MGKKIDKQGTGIIYKRTSPSGKSYIGKTFLQEQERWKQHVSEANRGEKLTKLNKAIKKYGGENFSVEILNLFAQIFVHFIQNNRQPQFYGCLLNITSL